MFFWNIVLIFLHNGSSSLLLSLLPSLLVPRMKIESAAFRRRKTDASFSTDVIATDNWATGRAQGRAAITITGPSKQLQTANAHHPQIEMKKQKQKN